MLKKQASRTVISFAGLHDRRRSAAVGTVPSNNPSIVRQTLPARYDLPEASPAAITTTSRAGYARTSLCLSVLAAFAEGFGAYGVALYPTADFPLEAILVERRESLQHPGNREIAAAGHAREFVLPSEKARFGGGQALDTSLPWYRTLPAAIYDTAAGWWAHWRREREIKKAVVALAQFDDRSLRDMGISSRSEIEQVVRYCRDC